MSNQTQLNDTLAGLDKVSKELDQVQSEIDRLLQHQQWLAGRKKDLEAKATRLQSECQRERPDVTKSDFAWSKKLHELKTSVFGVEEFRSLQEQTMNTTLSGQDCILVMPTGGGKSLCYQLPAIVSKGFTLVVSPLVSLMEDQTMALEQLNINASLLNAGLPQDRVKAVHQAMIDPHSKLKLLYVTPEKISKSKRFMSQLEKAYKKGLLARVAIDEIHCCSQWGHDFRPDYKILGLLKRQFADTPILGLTATATNSVLEDVKNILNIQGCVVFRASYNRANLFYQVRAKPSKHTDCIEEIVKLLNGKFKGQSGIIYCFSRRESEKVASDLRTLGIRALPYHADIESSSRSAVHRKWKNDQIQVVVATIAFGMGIDKPDVRFVIHHSLSKSIENYYQESGRAGRDDKRADCIVFLQFSDVFRQSTMVVAEQTGLNKLYNMIRYCMTRVKCRRSLLASHFGERWDGKVSCNGMCDNCLANTQVHRMDIQSDCRDIYDILTQGERKEQRMTANKVMDVMQGKTVGGIKINREGKVLKRPQILIEQIIAHLLLESYLKEDFHFTPYSTISYLIPGPKASRIQSSQDHCIILKTADPKGKKVANSSNERTPASSVNGMESKKHESPRVNTPGTSSTSSRKLSRGKKEKSGTNGKSKVMVIDLSDDSDDAKEVSNDALVVAKKRTAHTVAKSSEKRRLARRIVESETDDDDESSCMVVNDDDINISVSSKKQSTQIRGHDKEDSAATVSAVKNPSKMKTPKHLVKRKHGVLGKRKSEDRCDGATPRKNDGGTPSKKHKLDAAKVSSSPKKRTKLDKSTHDTDGKIKTTSQKVKGHTSKLALSNSGKSVSVLNGSANSGDELEEIHTVYSEQLASLELMGASIGSDSEDDFQQKPKHKASKTHDKLKGDVSKSSSRSNKIASHDKLPTFSLSFENSLDQVENIDDGADDIEEVYCKQMEELG